MSDIQYPSTATDVKNIIESQLKLIWNKPDHVHKVAPLMLWGAPGVGKSTIIRELCEQHDIDFIDIRLSQREPVDLRGLPVPKGDHVDWLLAGEWPRDPNSRGIILFDELSAADRTLQAAAYEIILDRRLGDLYSLPAGWLVMGAGNRIGDNAVSYTFSSALANRFCHLELMPDVEQWCRWAQDMALNRTVIGFLRFAPEHFFNMEGNVERGWPSPRSWERVSHVLKDAGEIGLSEAHIRLMVSGLIGPGATMALFAYRESENKLPDVNAMLAGKIAVSIPEQYDAIYAFCLAVAHFLWRSDKKHYNQRLNVFYEISSQLTSDFATLLMMDILREGNQLDETKVSHAFSHQGYQAWTTQHGQQFSAALSAGQLA